MWSIEIKNIEKIVDNNSKIVYNIYVASKSYPLFTLSLWKKVNNKYIKLCLFLCVDWLVIKSIFYFVEKV